MEKEEKLHGTISRNNIVIEDFELAPAPGRRRMGLQCLSQQAVELAGGDAHGVLVGHGDHCLHERRQAAFERPLIRFGKRFPGVGEISVELGGEFEVRIRLDPPGPTLAQLFLVFLEVLTHAHFYQIFLAF